MSQQTNEADIAAVIEVVRAHCDGMIEGDAAMLGRAFHPRSSIVGNEGRGALVDPRRGHELLLQPRS